MECLHDAMTKLNFLQPRLEQPCWGAGPLSLGDHPFRLSPAVSKPSAARPATRRVKANPPRRASGRNLPAEPINLLACHPPCAYHLACQVAYSVNIPDLPDPARSYRVRSRSGTYLHTYASRPGGMYVVIHYSFSFRCISTESVFYSYPRSPRCPRAAQQAWECVTDVLV